MTTMAVENIIFRISTEVADKDAPVQLAANIERLDKEYTDAQKKVNSFNQEVNKTAGAANQAAGATNNAAKGASTLGQTVQGAGKGMNNLGSASQGAAGAIGGVGKQAQQSSRDMKGLADNTQRTGGIIGESVKQFAQFFAIDALVRGVFNTFSSGVDSIIEFDDALAELSSITGATGTDLDFLREQAVQFSEASTVGASDVAKAFTAIGSARPDLLKNKEALSEVTKEAITLSEAAKIDLGTAGAAVAGAMNQFNLPASEASRIINVLAAGSLEGAANISEVGETIDKVGTVLASNNVTIEQGVALTETLAEKNLKGAEAGTQLRNVVLRLVQSGKGFVDGQFNINAALEQTRKEFDSISDPVKRAEAEIKLFGLESVTAGNILLENIGTYERLTDAVTGTSVAYTQAETNNATLAASLTKLGNAVENIFLKFTQSSSTLARGINFLASNLETILKVVFTVGQAFVAYRLTIVSITAAKKAYAVIVEGVSVAKRLYAIATTNAAGAQRAFNLAVTANPLGLLVTAITTALTVLMFWNDEVDEASKKQGELNDKTKEAIELRNRLSTAGTDIGQQVAARNKLNVDQLEALSANIDQQIAEYDRLGADAIAKEEAASDDIARIREERAQEIKSVEEQLAAEQDAIRRFDLQLYLDGLKSASTDEREIRAATGVAISSAEAEENKKRLQAQKKLVDDTLRERRKLEGKGGAPTVGGAKEAPALAGSIKALQEEQRKLLTLATEKVVAGSPEFFKIVAEYEQATARLKAAQDLLQKQETFPAGSLNDLNQELRFLQNVLNNLPADAENFDAVGDRVKEIQGLIDELNKRIEGTKPDTSRDLLEQLQERERSTLAFADLDTRAAVARAKQAGATEAEIKKIEQDSQAERLRLQIEFEFQRLAILEASGTATEAELTAQRNKIAELRGELNLPVEPDTDTQGLDTLIEKVVAAGQEIAKVGIDAWKAWSDAQQQALDLQIQAQEARVQEARDLADKGNSAVLEQEKKRLQQLNDERRRAARQSIAIAQLEAAAAGAVAIARAAAEGGGFLTALTIASTIIALTAGLAQARAITTASIPAFRKGGSANWSRLGGYTGSGNPDNISNVLGGKPYIYHADEYIMPHEVVSIGENKRWLEQIHRGRVDIGKMMSKNKGVRIGIDSDKSTDRIVRAIEGQPRTTVHMDGDGITMLVQGRVRKNNMLNTRR